MTSQKARTTNINNQMSFPVKCVSSLCLISIIPSRDQFSERFNIVQLQLYRAITLPKSSATEIFSTGRLIWMHEYPKKHHSTGCADDGLCLCIRFLFFTAQLHIRLALRTEGTGSPGRSAGRGPVFRRRTGFRGCILFMGTKTGNR